MRSMAIDNRLGVNIPGLIQGNTEWLPNGGFNIVNDSSSPFNPVYEVTATQGQQNCVSTFKKAIPGAYLFISSWLKATVVGTGPSTTGFGVWGDIKLNDNTSLFPQIVDISVVNAPTEWKLYQNIFKFPSNAVSFRPFLTLRSSVISGTYRVCGARCSIIGNITENVI